MPPPPTTAPPFAEVTEPAIAVLIDTFYARVRRDARLGPVFARAIAEDEWPAHLERMRGFWSSVMLTSGRYKGDPVGVHRRVEGIGRELFPRWLALFGATAADLFTPDLAALFAAKAERIADSLQTALFFRLDAGLPPALRRPTLTERGAFQCD